MELDLCDGAARQRVADSHETSVLITTVKRSHVHGHLANLEITIAVYHLQQQHPQGQLSPVYIHSSAVEESSVQEMLGVRFDNASW